VILPPTGALERDHYDLVFHTLAVRNTARFTPALFEKPAGTMHDWEIYREIVLRTQRLLTSRRPRRARLAQAARMRVSPTRTIDLLLRTSKPRLSVRRLRRGPVDLGPLRPCLPERLQTKGGRVHAAPQQVLDDLARLDAAPVSADGLVLVGRRHQRDNNSWMHNTPRLTKGRPRHQLYMHPADLAERAIADGAVVRVTSAVGTVEVEVQASDDMMPGVVSLPHGYGHRHPGVRMRRAVELPGASMNDLTDPSVLDASGNAVLSGVPVTVTPAR
jgi:anaerobic selenocysteine-containing dehydrogenase